MFGVLAGYALAQLHFRGRGVLFAAMLLLQVIPFQLLIIPLYVLIVRNYGLGDSYLGMIAPFAINSTAVFVFRQYFLQLPPELFDAARIDGASELRILTQYRAATGPAGAADRHALDVHRPVERVPVAVPGHQATRPAAARGRAGQLHQHRLGAATNPFGAILAGACVLAAPAIALFIVFQRHFVSSRPRLRREGLT